MINQPVVVVGHDFGTVVASRFALYEPARLRALVLLSVGYRIPGTADIETAIETAKAGLGYDVFGYWRFFGFDEEAPALIEKNVNSFIDLAFPPAEDALAVWRSNFAPTGKVKEWLQNSTSLPRRAAYLTASDYNVYLGYFLEGMQPKLNWYKSQFNNVNVEDEKDLDPTIQAPSLFIAGLQDALGVPALYASQKQYFKDLTTMEINATHWIMEHKSEEVNSAIEQWIKQLVWFPCLENAKMIIRESLYPYINKNELVCLLAGIVQCRPLW